MGKEEAKKKEEKDTLYKIDLVSPAGELCGRLLRRFKSEHEAKITGAEMLNKFYDKDEPMTVYVMTKDRIMARHRNPAGLSPWQDATPLLGVSQTNISKEISHAKH